MHTAVFGVFGIIRYTINLNMIAVRMSGPINCFVPYCFGCAVIQIGELNIWNGKCLVVGECDAIGDVEM